MCHGAGFHRLRREKHRNRRPGKAGKLRDSCLSGGGVPRGAGCFLAAIICGIFVSKVGIKPVVTVGLIVLATADLLFGEINTSISLVDIAFPNFVFGLGMIMAMVPL